MEFSAIDNTVDGGDAVELVVTGMRRVGRGSAENAFSVMAVVDSSGDRPEDEGPDGG